MRETQFVGLNRAAENFLQDAVNNPEFKGFTYGMFEEEIPLGQWTKDGHTYTEVLQEAPWSSGPVIFTSLKDENGLEHYSWVLVKIDENEYVDYEAGTYYV